MARIAITNLTCGGCAKSVAAILREALQGQEPCIDLAPREVTAESDVDRLVVVLRVAGWNASAAPRQ